MTTVVCVWFQRYSTKERKYSDQLIVYHHHLVYHFFNYLLMLIIHSLIGGYIYILTTAESWVGILSVKLKECSNLNGFSVRVSLNYMWAWDWLTDTYDITNMFSEMFQVTNEISWTFYLFIFGLYCLFHRKISLVDHEFHITWNKSKSYMTNTQKNVMLLKATWNVDLKKNTACTRSCRAFFFKRKS